jgi:TP901 family phage tail tape measure protein
MAKNTIELNIDFVQKGAPDLFRTITKLGTALEQEREKANRILSANPAQLDKMSAQYNKLGQQIQKIVSKVKDFQDAISEADGELTPQLENRFKLLASQVGSSTLQFKGLGQALNYTVEGTKDNVNNLINSLKNLGISSGVIRSLKGNFTELSKNIDKTGDTSGLFTLQKHLTNTYNKTLKIDDAIAKFGSLQIDSKKIDSTVNKLSLMKDALAANAISVQEVEAALKSSSNLYTSLSTKEKNLLSIRKEAKKEVEDTLSALKKQKESLDNILVKKGPSAATEDLNKANAAKQLLQAEILKVEGLLSKAPTKLSTGGVNAYVTSLQNGLKNVNSVITEVQQASSRLDLSKSFVNAREAAKTLNKEIAGIKQGFTPDSLSVLSQLKVKVREVSKELQQGTADPALAKAELATIYKKIEVLKQANALEKEAAANLKAGTIKPEEYNQTTQSLRAFGTEILNDSKAVGYLQDKMNTLKSTFNKKIEFDKNYDKILASYRDQKAALERLINTKLKWAPRSTLNEAISQLDELKISIDKAEKSKKQFDTSFKSAPIDAIQDATSETIKLEKELDATKRRTKEVSAELSKMSKVKWLGNIANRALAYAGLYAGIYQVINTMKKGIEYSVEFDQAQHTLSAVLDMSANSANRLERNLSKLSVTYGGNLKDINEAALALGRAGIASNNVAEATENVIKMARLTGDTFATSASALITFNEVFGDVKDAVTGTTDTITDFADKLAYAANQSRLSTQDLGTLSNYALAAAKSSGITANAVLAMATAFSNAGVNASTIGTQIRRFATTLSESSSDMDYFYSSLGINQKSFMTRLNLDTKESNKAMTELINKLKNLSDADFSQLTSGMDILARQSLTLLRNNADEFFRHLSKLNAGVKGEVDKAAYVTESYAITWEKLGNSLGIAFNELATNILPIVFKGVESLTQKMSEISLVIKKVSDNWDEFKDNFINNISIIAGTVGLGLLITKAGAATTTVIGLVNALKNMVLIGITPFLIHGVGALGVFGGAAASAAGGVGILSGAVGLLKAALNTILRHPVILAIAAIGTAAYYAADAIRGTKNEIETLGIEENIQAISDKIRDLQRQYRTATGNNKIKIALEIDKNQSEISKLNATLQITNSLLDTRENLGSATAYAQAYVRQTPELTAITGTKAQQEIDKVITSMLNTLDSALKGADPKNKLLVNAITDEVAILKKQQEIVKNADFSSGKNKAAMTDLIKWLNEQSTVTTELSDRTVEAANALTNSAVTSQKAANATQRLIPVLEETIKSGLKPGSIKELSTLVDNIEKKLSMPLNITGGTLANVSQSTVVGSTKTSTALSGPGIEIGTSSIQEATRLVDELQRYKNEIAGLGDVVLEVNEQTKQAVIRIGEGKGKLPDFKKVLINTNGDLNVENLKELTSTNSTVPLASQPSAIQLSDKQTEVIKVVSDEYIKNLKQIATDIQTLYQNNINVTERSNVAVENFKQTAIQMNSNLEKQLTNWVSEQFNIDGGKVAGDLAAEFSNKLKEAKIEDLPRLFNELEDAIKNTVASTDKERTQLEGLVAAFKTYAKIKQDILDIDAAQNKLSNLGNIDEQKAIDLTQEHLKQQKDYNVERNKGFLTASRFSALQNGDATTFTKINELGGIQNDLMKSKAETTQYLNKLLSDQNQLEKDIVKHNSSNKQDLLEKNKLLEKSQFLQTEIKKVDTDVANIDKQILSTQNQITAATYEQYHARLLLKATALDYLNDTNVNTAEINRLDELQKLLDAGYTKTDALAQMSLVSAKQTLISALTFKAKMEKEVVGFGAGSDTDYTLYTMELNKQLNEQIGLYQIHYNTLAAQKAEYEAQFDTMAEGQKKLEMQKEINALELQMQEAHTAELAAIREKDNKLKEAEFNRTVDLYGKGFGAMGQIAEAFYLLSGKKSKAAFAVYKAAQVAQAIVNTYVGATKALAEGGPFLGPVLAAGQIAAGMAQVAQIKAQTYHTGGYVTNDNKTGLKRDEVPAILQTGEYVLSRNDLKAINQASKQPAAPAAQSSEVVIVNSMDESVIEQYLSSRAGRQIINNAIRR